VERIDVTVRAVREAARNWLARCKSAGTRRENRG